VEHGYGESDRHLCQVTGNTHIHGWFALDDHEKAILFSNFIGLELGLWLLPGLALARTHCHQIAITVVDILLVKPPKSSGFIGPSVQ